MAFTLLVVFGSSLVSGATGADIVEVIAGGNGDKPEDTIGGFGIGDNPEN